MDKSRSLGQRLRGAGKIAQDDPVAAVIEEILRAEADFADFSSRTRSLKPAPALELC